MGIFEYFKGRRIRLESPLSPDEVAKRINRASGSRFNLFSRGIKGGVLRHHMNLFDQGTWPFSYNASPVLVGRLMDKDGGCAIDAKFRAPVWVYGFYIMWYLIVTLFVLIAVALVLEGRMTTEGWIIFPAMAFFSIAPVGLHYLFVRGEQSLEGILQMLTDEGSLIRIE
ncbi:hypothetical protein [Aurantiacibacter zhengii]|uniref:Uncharacterized protein n=1 Tax=Aurantiacibacter zhengii TaxID=2307003 RepID=A0A418NT64_9SPHN|nr:hypothetical protein [Aurantiacibacter zhengii]RIV86684.1 hypothetical protein D2V07_08255 [Aurantiacibacter zhengii]